MCAANVAHCWVSPNLHDVCSSFVVLEKASLHGMFRSVAQYFPEREEGDTRVLDGRVSGHNLSFRGTVRNAGLLLG